MGVQPTIYKNCVILSCQYKPKHLRNVSSTVLNLCHKEVRLFVTRKGVQANINMYLLKWAATVFLGLCFTSSFIQS